MKPMSASQYRAAIKRLGFPETDQPGDSGVSAAGRFFGVHPATGRDWAAKGPPMPVVACLRLMEAAGISAAKARKLLDPSASAVRDGSKKRED